ncbi:TetR/AcrR family transcriptional regulator (plasmid) [Alicyclobacillus fastidiosus]|uniref:TetR/AcrR family transcriptional regulator n=1 Tax=Alicyclobacillus fastidiosus TaxID=392011 RepID=A0ABY6ZRR3_9BACL|nr:TetR/AcrR family transcriptional regulator [Alicyclobacillus fastidiosus]WAH44816.1 TetR/AcrR family transcriptional regulator [Alicyclobacillus fastidiosus]GMA65779.1 putative HTH-type transcriptional regulator YdgC [Alicyclobacillus fastidiosus]
MSKKGKGERTRERILEAAAEEFASRGFYETKTIDILSKVGLTQPALYKHFPNKQSIYCELVDGLHVKFRRLIETARLGIGLTDDDVSAGAKEAVIHVFNLLFENPNVTRIAFFMDQNAENLKLELVKLIQKNIQSEQEMGYIRSDISAEIAAVCLVGMIERLTLEFLLPGKKSPESLADDVFGIFAPAMINKGSEPNPIDIIKHLE